MGTFLLAPPREGRLGSFRRCFGSAAISTRAPTGGATRAPAVSHQVPADFYSRPHGRGDWFYRGSIKLNIISTRAPTGGATGGNRRGGGQSPISTRAPTGGATGRNGPDGLCPGYFYSRPHGRGDSWRTTMVRSKFLFLLAPPREGRLDQVEITRIRGSISTRAPTGGATGSSLGPCSTARTNFYSRPHGRGDYGDEAVHHQTLNFYSRPHGRGDGNFPQS